MEKGEHLEDMDNLGKDKIKEDLFNNLRAIHLLNIVHNDIKPDNIMYSR